MVFGKFSSTFSVRDSFMSGTRQQHKKKVQKKRQKYGKTRKTEEKLYKKCVYLRLKNIVNLTYIIRYIEIVHQQHSMNFAAHLKQNALYMCCIYIYYHHAYKTGNDREFSSCFCFQAP